MDLEASAPSRSALTRANERAGDVHIENGDIAGLEAAIRGRIHGRCKLEGGVEQLDALIRVHSSVVRGRRQPEHRSRDLLGIRRSLRDGGVGPGDARGLASTWFETLAEAQLEVSESRVGSVAIADRGVDLWVGLEANGRTSQSPACFLQRQPRADDLRRLFARSRQHLGKRHDSALRSGYAGVKTHHGAHRHGSRTRAHANSFCRHVSARAKTRSKERDYATRSLGYVQDVARTRFRDARNQRTDVGDRGFERTRHGQDRRFSGLRAAATRHAGWRTRAVILARLLVTRAGLCNDQGVGAGGAERQQRDDDCERRTAAPVKCSIQGWDRWSRGFERRERGLQTLSGTSCAL